MSERNVATLRLAVAAFNRRDAEAFDACSTDDAEIVPVRAALEDAVYRGADAGAQYCAAVELSWVNLTWEVEEIHDGGDWVLGLGRIQGRGRSSGAEIDAHGGWVACFDGALIARFQTFSERAEALAAVGLAR